MTNDEMLALETQLIQEIGRELNKLALVRGPGVIFYAEPSDTLVQSAAFSGDDREMTVTTPSTEINTLVRDLWRVRREAAPAQAWAAMTYIYLNEEFRITYIMPKDMYAGANANERCKNMIRAVLGPVNVRAI